jgi:hypothetical protein
MQVTISKLVALLLAVAEVIVTFLLAQSLSIALTAALGVLLPLALIWFPESFGDWTGWGTRAPVHRPSAPQVVAGMGWLFLLGLPVLGFFLAGNHR